MAETISVRDCTFTYHAWNGGQNKPVLSHFSLSLKTGEKLLLLAPFDAGKSTLARILAGLCPKYLSGELAGDLMVDGHDLRETEPWELVRSVGYVSQNPQEQFVAQTVEDELAFPLESLGVDRKEMHRQVEESLTRWGLVSLKSDSEAELSGGERKRVLLALNCMLDPACWILDESFDDLDSQWRRYLSECIKGTNHSVLVLASRYLPQFDGLFDRFGVLDGGSFVEGSLDEVKGHFARLSGDDELCPLVREPADGNLRRLDAKGIEVHKTRLGDEKRKVFDLSVPGFTLSSGQIVTLLGLNGSGKSTFARLCCGLDVPSQGVFFLDGQTADTDVLNRNVGYLFQNPDLQIFLPTVRDELSWSLVRERKYGKEQIGEMVGEVADLFGLSLDETPSTMSYPKRKNLQAAVYYLLDRPFYILDELDNALTYRKAEDLVRLLYGKGSGILVITHDRSFARLVADDGYEIVDGRMRSI